MQERLTLQQTCRRCRPCFFWSLFSAWVEKRADHKGESEREEQEEEGKGGEGTKVPRCCDEKDDEDDEIDDGNDNGRLGEGEGEDEDEEEEEEEVEEGVRQEKPMLLCVVRSPSTRL